MSYAPATILQARAYLKRHTGLPDAALGIVGDQAHAYGYHLGKDRLPANDYSARTNRDRAGLTNAAAALDIGSFSRLRQLTAHLVREARAGRARDVREVIGPGSDGRAYRWDVTDNWTPRQRSRGDSHEWHTHLSFFRDSESRSKIALFKSFFEPQEDDDMTKEEFLAHLRYALPRVPISFTSDLDEPEKGTRYWAGDLMDKDQASFRQVAMWSLGVATDKITKPELVKIRAELAALTAAVGGQDAVAAVRTTIRQEFATLGAALAAELGEAVTTEAVEEALRRVLGSLDEGGA